MFRAQSLTRACQRSVSRISNPNSRVLLKNPTAVTTAGTFSGRFMSTYSNIQLDNMDLVEWSTAFKRETVDIANTDTAAVSYQDAAENMRALLKSNILLHDDIVHRPERFFRAHKLLGRHATKLGPGFWIRFTVHYNLCMGSVMGLGNDEQIELLKEYQKEGKLGCFSLTEKYAGVNSGLLVETTADWDPETETFVLNTPTEGAKKNWISQGLVADVTTVIATLRMGGKSLGPHAFLMPMRETVNGVSTLVPGITVGDMGRKTVGNDLDNAWIAFDHVRLPKSALLNRYCDIVDNKYVSLVKDRPVFHMIGQRLFTGRVAVAQAALEFTKALYQHAETYTNEKKCWSPAGEISLSQVPQLRALYKESRVTFELLETFVQACEKELTCHLKNNTLPPVKLVDAIAVAKVRTVEDCISLAFRLKNELGSYALMAGTGFDQTDFLQCCKFAEGDSRILMQKMARDIMKEFRNSEEGKVSFYNEQWDFVTQACYNLERKLENHPDHWVGWEEHFADVYEIAELHMTRTMKNYVVAKQEAEECVCIVPDPETITPHA